MDAEFRRMGSSDRLLQADAIAESYLRNLVVFYAGVALVFFGHGVVTANFALWNIDVLARGSDAAATNGDCEIAPNGDCDDAFGALRRRDRRCGVSEPAGVAGPSLGSCTAAVGSSRRGRRP